MLKAQNLFIFIVCITSLVLAFDWENYIIKYNLTSQGIRWFHPALHHYVTDGIQTNKKSLDQNIEFTNFDWEYYKDINKLDINNQEEAISHYESIGKEQDLDYCQKFSFLITLHMYNLNLLDEFIDKINHFMKINPLNIFHVKINIPIDSNIDSFNHETYNKLDIEKTYDFIKNCAPYHSELVTHENCVKLYSIYAYIYEKLNIRESNLQIMFSENRGVDVGGFLLMLDQAIKQDIPHDFVIKLHSKTVEFERLVLTSLLNCKINKLCRKYEAIYSMSMHFPDAHNPYLRTLFGRDVNENMMQSFLDKFNLPLTEFDFAIGTIFLTSSKMTEFFAKQDLIKLFNQLNFRYPVGVGQLEHIYERFFGYLIKHLNCKTLLIDYVNKQDLDTFLNI